MANSTLVNAVGILRVIASLLSNASDTSLRAQNEEDTVYRYAVIVDAGSSGSRVHGFKFRVPKAALAGGDTYYEMDVVDTIYVATTPGLSSYAKNPKKGAHTIYKLLRRVKDFVPKEEKAKTPLLVCGTAGLRLLSSQQSLKLIDHVRAAISKLGYYIDKSSIEAMSGTHEGIFAWYAANILHKKLDKETYGIIDLGGASMQIAYKIKDKDISNFPIKEVFLVTIGVNSLTIHVHSYLGLGIDQARKGILNLSAVARKDSDITSVCFDPSIGNDTWWLFMNVNYTVRGVPREDISEEEAMTKCYSAAKKYLFDRMDSRPSRPPNGRIAGFNTFYRLVQDAGISVTYLKNDMHGSASVKDFWDAAKRTCATGDKDKPFLCLELIYAYALLHDALLLPENKTFMVTSEVDGIQVNWPFGLAYMTILRSLSHPFVKDETCAMGRRDGETEGNELDEK